MSDIILMILVAIISLLWFPTLSQKPASVFHIDLSLPPQSRYTSVIAAHRSQLLSFLSYLHSSPLYVAAFSTSSYLSNHSHLLQPQFLAQCEGIANLLNLPTSQIVVFNYMYELGAFNDFCTSIIMRTESGQPVLGRNLDYGFQGYLANSTVELVYEKEGKEIARVAGHAGFVGCHTAMRTGRYAVTLNQRIDGGLRDTLKSMLEGCQQIPFLLRKTVLSCESAECAIEKLSISNLCASVYFIVASETANVVIQRNRIGPNNIYNLQSEGKNFIVQTNTDRDKPDPDGRRTLAEMRLSSLNLTQTNLRNVLLKYPNFNPLTLMTVIMNPLEGTLNATVWFDSTLQF